MKRVLLLVLVLMLICVDALADMTVLSITAVTSAPEATATQTPAAPTPAVTAAATPTVAPTSTPAPTATRTPVIPASGTDLGGTAYVWEEDGEATRDGCIIDLIADPNAPYQFVEGRAVLEIVFPQIVSADAAILRMNGHVMMIDAGGETEIEAVAEALRLLGVDEIELGVNTHPHHDHLPGFVTLQGTAKLDKLLYGFGENANSQMREGLAALAAQGVPTERVWDGTVLTIAGLGEQVYVTRRVADGLSVNNHSLVLKVTYGKRSILIPGDNEKDSMKLLVSKPPESGLSADIIKYPHHGYLRLYQPFAEMVAPKLAVITNRAEKSFYGNQSLEQFGIAGVYSSEGIIRLRTDGEIWVLDLLR